MSKTMISREDVTEAENRLFSAQLASDVNVLSQLLHDDLIGVSPTGQVVTKEMDLDTYRNGVVSIEEASVSIEEIRLLDDTAVSVVDMKAKGKMMGNPLEGHFRYLRVWKYFDGTLKVIAAGFMQIS